MACPPLRLLSVEPSFPGRLGPLCDWLVRHRGFRATSLHVGREHPEFEIAEGHEVVPYPVGGVARASSVAWSAHLERGYCYAYGALETLTARPVRDFDLILGHSGGRGSTLFLPPMLPRVPIVQLIDPWIAPRAGDLAEEDVASLPLDYVRWRRSANAMTLLDLENGVHGWVESPWVRSGFPIEYQEAVRVCSTGVDTRFFRPAHSRPTHLGSHVIDDSQKLVLFVARGADRMRGLDQFLRLAEALIEARGDVICAIAGNSHVMRMLDVKEHGQDALAMRLATSPQRDHPRLWILGLVSQPALRSLYQRAELHVVPGRLAPAARVVGESMACGGLVLGWDNPPMREWIEPDERGLLVPFGDEQALLDAARRALDDPHSHERLRRNAREWVRDQKDRAACLDVMTEWFAELVLARTT